GWGFWDRLGPVIVRPVVEGEGDGWRSGRAAHVDVAEQLVGREQKAGNRAPGAQGEQRRQAPRGSGHLLPLDAGDLVTVEVNHHRHPAVLPVRPRARVERWGAMRRRVAERQEDVVLRHALLY